MAENTDLGLSDSEAAHQAVMRSIAEKMADTPYVLKGGTALLFARGLDRHSTDLDFDSHIALNLESRIRQSFEEEGLELTSLNLYKDTDTTQRYKIHYANPINGQDEFLKIETKVSMDVHPDTLETVNGIKTYDVNTAFGQKLDAVEGRASVRDLYDVRHMLKYYGDELSDEKALRAAYMFADEEAVYSAYEQNHSEDPILNNESLERMVIETKMEALHLSSERENGIELSAFDQLAVDDYFASNYEEQAREEHEAMNPNGEKKSERFGLDDFINPDVEIERGPIESSSISFPDIKAGQVITPKDQNDIQLYLLDAKARLDAMEQSGDKRIASDAFDKIKDAAFPLLNREQQKVWEPPTNDRGAVVASLDDDFGL